MRYGWCSPVRSRTVVDAEGYEVIHFVHGPGMTLGEPGYFSIERTRIVEVIAVEPSTMIRLDRRELTPFMVPRVSEFLGEVTG